MMGHQRMNLGYFIGLIETEDVAIFDAAICLDQLAVESIEVRTAREVHDVSPAERLEGCDHQKCKNVTRIGNRG